VTAEKPDTEGINPVTPGVSADDLRLLEALRGGDETAFVSLLDQYQTSLVRLAMVYVPNRVVAEEVVQETWLAVFQGLNRFQAHSSLKTWIFRILVNRAKTRATREGRSIPFSSLPDLGAEGAERAVDPDRFIPPGHPWSGHWAYPPHRWNMAPEELVLAQETRALIEEAVARLPLRQREVITLRDVEGWTSEEVCNVLGIRETNQRVLLHRARSTVRRALERYLDEGVGPA
jgi:RNA polymerase sigma-70 factor (ECF subfamily)